MSIPINILNKIKTCRLMNSNDLIAEIPYVGDQNYLLILAFYNNQNKFEWPSIWSKKDMCKDTLILYNHIKQLNKYDKRRILPYTQTSLFSNNIHYPGCKLIRRLGDIFIGFKWSGNVAVKITIKMHKILSTSILTFPTKILKPGELYIFKPKNYVTFLKCDDFIIKCENNTNGQIINPKGKLITYHLHLPSKWRNSIV